MIFIIWGKIFHCFGLIFKFLYILSFFPEIMLQRIQPCEVLGMLIFYPATGVLTAFFQLVWFRNLNFDDLCESNISVRGGGGWGAGGAPAPPVGKTIVLFGQSWCTVRAKTVKNILLFNFLIYLFLSRNSPNLLTDLCTTSRDGCYCLELEHWVLPRDWEW